MYNVEFDVQPLLEDLMNGETDRFFYSIYISIQYV